MKRIVYSLGIVTIATALTSCVWTKQKNEVVTVAFESFKADTVCQLFLDYEKPACQLNVDLEQPVAETAPALRNSLNRFITGLVDLVTEDSEIREDLQEMTDVYFRNYIRRYLSEGKDAIANYDGDMRAAAIWMSYVENVTGRVTFQEEGLISYVVTSYSYAGGAHGTNIIYNGVYDVARTEPVRLADIFSDLSLPLISNMIETQISIQNNGRSIEDLKRTGILMAESHIEPTENFGISDLGMTWMYNTYEIAPYAVGSIEVLLSWRDLVPYIDRQSDLLPLAKKYSM